MSVRRGMHTAAGYLFLLPYLTLFSVFLLFPLLYGLRLSFTNFEMISPEAVAGKPPTFVGTANYREALDDAFFWKALGATSKFVVFSVPLVISVALTLAVGIESVHGKRQNLYRLAVFLPTMITISVGGILWRWFYNREFGVFNGILDAVGLTKVRWLDTPNLAMFSVILMTLWWTVGGPTVILLAGLKQIPNSYYEAAAIDGAVGWKRFWLITLPLLRPVLLFVTVINVIGAFQIFGQTFMITRGGPTLSTRVLVQYIYETAFNFYRLGYGAAMSWLLFLVIVTFSIIQFRVLREK
jgi:ABC-type sugar transport system permease subunit